VSLEIDEQHNAEMFLIPFSQFDTGVGARRIFDDQAAELMGAISHRSEQLAKPGFVEAEWDRWCAAHRGSYLRSVRRYRRLLALFPMAVSVCRRQHVFTSGREESIAAAQTNAAVTVNLVKQIR